MEHDAVLALTIQEDSPILCEPIGHDEEITLDDPRLYLNRELSWLRVNERILEEAENQDHPILERLKFLAICGSNLDEFFMVRVSSLKKQLTGGALRRPPDKTTPEDQISLIRREVNRLQERYERLWNEVLIKELKEKGVHIKKMDELNGSQSQAVRKYFEYQIFPTLTPLAMDITHPFPFISNQSLNLAVVMEDDQGREKYARVKMPLDAYPRLIQLFLEEYEDSNDCARDRGITLVFLEDIVSSNLDRLFPGMKIIGVYPFRVTRDAEIEIRIEQASDLLTAIEESMETRRLGEPIRIQVDKSMPEHVRELFKKNCGLNDTFVYQFNGPLRLVDFWQLLTMDRPDLKDTPFLPYTPEPLNSGNNIFHAIEDRDWVLYHPYDSFGIIENLINQAARDSDVLAIKMTMYRIEKNSPIIDALLKASQKKKNVTVLVELKAKFDEENNMNWAKTLEQAGVHVVYGFADIKVHAKLCLIVRKQNEKIKIYSHISSGNYNSETSRVYADIGYLTANHTIGTEVNDCFNYLTGYSQKDDYMKLIVAPKTLRKEVIKRIEREIEQHKKTGDGYIALKLNNLEAKKVIKALYRASMAGVKIDLNVRALCGLRPGVKGISDNIREISIIGRFLEHTRILYFRNGGEDEVLLGSSDLMPRNLDRRVEVLFPIPDPKLKKAVIKHMLNIHLNDNVKARILRSDGLYRQINETNGKKKLNSQKWLLKNRGIWHEL